MLLGEHAVVYSRPCIVTAVDQRLHLTAQLIEEPFFIFNAPDVKIKNYKKPISKLGKGTIPAGAKFVELATRSLLVSSRKLQGETLFKGIKITTSSDFSSQYGFGSSSASTVCTIFALSKLLGLKLTQKQLFDLAYKTVLEIQGKASGFDIAAAVWGGTLYFVTGSKVIRPILPPTTHISPIPLIVSYSGTKAKTTDLITKVADLEQKHPDLVQKTFDLVEKVVENGKKVIKNGDFETLGELFNINQGYLESLGVSTPKLSAMIYAARKAGAYGAKLSGAGGGDCIIALAPQSKVKPVKKAITRSGGKIIKVKTNAEGVKQERG
jgi:mevalonate kinase